MHDVPSDEKKGFDFEDSWRLFRHDFAGKGKWFRSQTFLVPRFPATRQHRAYRIDK